MFESRKFDRRDRRKKNRNSKPLLRQRRCRRLLIESLEDRRMLSIVISLNSADDSGRSNSDSITNVAAPRFEVTVDNSGSIGVDFNGDGTSDVQRSISAPGVYEFSSPTLADGQHTITASITPLVGNKATASTQVTIDTLGPRLLSGPSVAPAPTDHRTLTFNEPINPDSLQAQSILLSRLGESGTSAVSNVTGSGKTFVATFNPLITEGRYTLSIAPTVQDVAGNLLDQNGNGAGGEPDLDIGRDAFTVLANPTWLTTAKTINAQNTTYEGADLVVDGTTLTVTGQHSFHSLWVINNGQVTHSARDTAGMQLTLMGDLVVDAGGRITADAQGYSGGVGGGAGQGPGGGAAVSYIAGAGGSYGGTGGYSSDGRRYGSAAAPSDLGSGGGHNSDNNPAGRGGNGGGAIRLIVAGALTVDGLVTANGENGVNSEQGGGSGGSIWITTGTLQGSGSLRADGGAGNGSGGGGGGGRIAVYYNQADAFTGFTNSTAKSAAGGQAGAVGTVAFIDQTIANGHWHVYTAFAFERDADKTLGDLTVHSGAAFTVYGATTLRVGDVTVASGGRITADAQGYSGGVGGGAGQGPGGGAAVSYSAGAGGSYGGTGGYSSDGKRYGSAAAPFDLGSGGGHNSDNNPAGRGGNGGGAIRLIVAGALTVDGLVTSNGENGVNSEQGGGSGGSIWITTGTLQGSGSLHADGGAGIGSGGGGGGGRIAVYSWNTGGITLPAASITAKGGTGAVSGGEGSVYSADTPFVTWLTKESLFHGTTILAWAAEAVNPFTSTVDLTAYSDQQAIPIAVNLPIAGSFNWDTTTLPDGAYQIKAVFHDPSAKVVATLSRQIGINNAVAWHTGLIAADTTWDASQVHVVEGSVTVATGAHLTIQPGAVVKFVPGEGIQLVVQNGGTLSADAVLGSPIVLTSLADDTAGGDTNYDGSQTQPKSGDWNGLLVAAGGTEDLSPFVSERYILLNVACIQLQTGYAHQTINGRSTLLAAVVKNNQFPLTYSWSFGDGSPAQTGTIASQAAAYNVETDHTYPNSGPGTPYMATLRVVDASGNSASDQYAIVVEPDSLDVERIIAIDKGLWWLHKQIQRYDTPATSPTGSGTVPAGKWVEGSYNVALTASAVLAFENDSHLPTGDPTTDPYVEDVQRGLNHLLTQMVTQAISQNPSLCPYGNPDTNDNGIGISINSDRYTYEIGPAMMALVASGVPTAAAQTGPANIIGRTYKDIVTDMVDMCAWGQNDSGSGRGGWRYAWNYGDTDNSVTQWPELGIEAAETVWGIAPPSFVKRELETWLTHSQDANGAWGYGGPDGNDNFSHVGAAIAGLSFSGDPSTDTRIQRGLAYMNANWNASTWGGTVWDNKYGMYAVAKGLRIANPPITMVGAHDWYAEFSTSLVGRQGSDGSWPLTSNWTSGLALDTAFSLLAANAPDGIFDGKTSHVYADTTVQLAGLPNQRHDYTVTMIVKDDDPTGARSAQATQIVTLSMVNHPPVSDPGGPYVGYVGLPVTLDGIKSYDPDAGQPLYNHIASYGWQLTDAPPYQFADATTMAVNWTWSKPGSYKVGLKVTDRFGLSTIAWTTVQIGTGNPTNLFVRPDLEGEYHSPVDLMAQLTTPTGSPVANMPIDFYVDLNHDESFDPIQEFVGEIATDATGWATFPFAQRVLPDDYSIEARFAGRDLYFASTADGMLELERARTVVVYTGDTEGRSGNLVTLSATLTDFVGDPLANLPLVFTLGTQQANSQTDAAGQATTSIPLGQTVGDRVTVSFAGTTLYEDSSDSSPFQLPHTSPTLPALTDQTIDEGQPLALGGTFIDPDRGQFHTVSVDWGDGSPEVSLTLVHDERTFSIPHSYVEEGSYTATLTVTDEDGSDEKIFHVNVTDPPVLPSGGVTLSLFRGRSYANQTVATFTDPGGAEPYAGDPDSDLNHHYAAMIDWGDQSNSTGLITASGGVFTVQGGHAYATEGTYTITATINHESARPATATSTAVVKNHVGLLLLDPDASGSLSLSDVASVAVNDFNSIVVDSNNRQAVIVAGDANVSAMELDVTGGIRTTGAGKILALTKTSAPLPDPLGLPLPPTPSQTRAAVLYEENVPLTLNPGTYVGGIKIDGGPVTLTPGVYYMQGGGFYVTDRGSVTGEGVLIVNAPVASSDVIRVDDRASVTLTPPVTLPVPYARYAGISLFQDPASNAPIRINDHASLSLAGVLYAPKATLQIFSGDPQIIAPATRVFVNTNPTTSLPADIILYDLRMTGTSSLTIISPDSTEPLVTVNSLTTANNRPTLTGTVTSGSTASPIVGVSILVAGQELSATLRNGTWSATVPKSLLNGIYDVQATVKDAVGNTAGDVTTGELTVQTPASAPTVAAPSPNSEAPMLSETATVCWPETAAPDNARSTALDTATNELPLTTADLLVTVAPLITNNNRPTLTGIVSDLISTAGALTLSAASPWQNQTLPYDVNNDGLVTPIDALIPINHIDFYGASVVPPVAEASAPPPYLDVNGDNQVTALDVLEVITFLNDPIPGTVQPATANGPAEEQPLSPGIAGVTVVVGGQTLTATVTGNAWSVTLSAALADGTYDVQATATDTAGNTFTDATNRELTIDTVAPAPSMARVISTNNQPTLRGLVIEPSPSSGIADVTVVIAGQTLHPTLTGRLWSVVVPAPLADGTYNAKITATDKAGNTAEWPANSPTYSLSHLVTIDTGKPVLVVNKLVTNSRNPTLKGAVADPAPGTGIVAVNVLVNSQSLAANISGGIWSVTVPIALADGTYDVQATATDTAGNTFTDTETGALTVYTGKPVVTVASLITNNNQPTLSGTAVSNSSKVGIATVKVLVGSQSLMANVKGNIWTAALPAALTDGTYDVQAIVTDAAGSTTTDGTTNELTIDTVSPAVTFAPLTTTVTTPTLTGTITDASPSSGIATVTVLVGTQTLNAIVSDSSWSATAPTALADGTYDIRVTATDRAGNLATTAASKGLTVGRVNPTLNPIPDQTATLGQTLTVTAVASDPETPPVHLTFSLDAPAPADAAIDPSTGVFTWTPASSPQTVTVTIRVSDDGQPPLSATQSFLITVGAIPVNRPPTFNTKPPGQVTAGTGYVYNANATDPDDDPISYSLASKPSDMNINTASGAITWSPSVGDIQSWPIIVRATDSQGAFTDQPYTLIVSPDIQPPQVVLTVTKNVVGLGDQVTFHVQAADDVGVAALALTVGGSVVSLNASGNASMFLSQAGLIDAVATATDTSGNKGTSTLQVRVIDPTYNTYPQVQIISPTMNESVTYLTDIKGTVQDTYLEFWRLEYAKADLVDLNNLAADNPNYVLIAQGTAAVNAAKLGTFDPTLLSNDGYVIRLLAQNTNGLISAQPVIVNVSGDAKLGNFHLDFTDLSIPLAGIPITITRSYDTLNANSLGDFGYGWTLSTGDPKIRETVPDGQSFQVGTRVYLTDPAGKRVGFTFTPDVQGTIFGVLWTPKFTADPGVHEKLEVYDTYAGPPGGLIAALGGPYNPSKYKLTTQDGTLYEYDQDVGLQKITDLNSNTLTFTTSGIVHSAGPSVTFQRDSEGRITKIIDTAGNSLQYAYNSVGDLVSFTNQAGDTTRYEHLADPRHPHFLDQIYDSRSIKVFDAEFDPVTGQLIGSTDASGGHISQTFDPGSFSGTITDAKGNVTVLFYDDRGNVLEKHEPNSEDPAHPLITKYEYGNASFPDKETKITDRNGVIETRRYDVAGNLTVDTKAFGTPQETTTTETYDNLGDVTSIQQNGQPSTVLHYNGQGKTTEIVNAAGDIASATFDSKGRQVSFTDFNGNATTFDYATGCPCGSPGKIIYADGTYEVFDRNRLAQVTKDTIYEADGTLAEVHTTTYDDLGRAIEQVDGQGADQVVTRKVYDGNLLDWEIVVNPASPNETPATPIAQRKSRITDYQYDDAGRMIEQIDAEGGVTEFRYDLNGNRVLLEDPVGNITTWVYNAQNKVVEERDPFYWVDFVATHPARFAGLSGAAFPAEIVRANDEPSGASAALDRGASHVTVYAYDGEGNQTEIIDRDDRRRTFEYDVLGHLTLEKWWEQTSVADPWTLVRTITSTYNTSGNLLSISDPDSTYTYTYDILNRVVTVDNADTPDMPHVVLTYTYDAMGNVVSTSDNLGVTVRSTYDSRNRLAKRWWEGAVDPARVDFFYTAAGREKHIDRYADLAGANRVGYTDRMYDTAGRNKDIVHRNAVDAVLAEYHYQYDFGGLLKHEDRLGDWHADYNYDRTGQLLAADYSGADVIPEQVDEYYTYDANGNRTSSYLHGTGYRTGPANELLTDGTYNYAYDDEGNMVRKTEIATGQVTVFEYDHSNRMFRATIWSSDPSSGGMILHQESYRYDALGRRIMIVADGQVTKTIYNGDNAWADFNAANAIVARYLFGNKIDQLIAQHAPGTGTTWTLSDHLGTVREIVGPTGQVINRIAYSTFGQLLSQTNPALLSRYLFTGRELDEAIGLYNFRARFYDPALGRFVRYDPMRFAAGDLNCMRYALNSPSVFVDPSGTMAETVIFNVTIALPTIPAALMVGAATAATFFVAAYLLSSMWSNTQHPNCNKPCPLPKPVMDIGHSHGVCSVPPWHGHIHIVVYNQLPDCSCKEVSHNRSPYICF
ncbi:MAG: Ig-like domain-containing protein [Planctomycetota bacterium]|nr:Ig-like domain-containing protein [Planctomycetota bacterium]